jgi:GNAT superfamily N-acetyltransferase
MTVSGVTVRPYAGSGLREVVGHVALLRIAVFRDWPYLYDGTLDYEQRYLDTFAQADDAVIVVARDGDRVIGAATGSPLLQHAAKFSSLFAARGLDPRRIFYCGESVLLPEYRGKGLGHAFFDHREAHARSLRIDGEPYTHSAFCGVVRPDTHPSRPAGYRPLDGFWTKRGYQRIDGMIGHFEWLDIGEAHETEKPMQFWIRPL